MLEQKQKRKFGFSAFNTEQKKMIEFLIQDQLSAAIFPTGPGKSLSHHLQALFLPHLTLIEFPLLALMTDQINSIRHFKIAILNLGNTFISKRMMTNWTEAQSSDRASANLRKVSQIKSSVLFADYDSKKKGWDRNISRAIWKINAAIVGMKENVTHQLILLWYVPMVVPYFN